MEQETKIDRLEDVFDSYDFSTDVRGFDQTNEPDPTMERMSFFAEEEDGCLYHYCGKSRIKVHEHFASHGRTLPDLIENVILHTAKNTA